MKKWRQMEKWRQVEAGQNLPPLFLPRIRKNIAFFSAFLYKKGVYLSLFPYFTFFLLLFLINRVIKRKEWRQWRQWRQIWDFYTKYKNTVSFYKTIFISYT